MRIPLDIVASILSKPFTTKESSNGYKLSTTTRLLSRLQKYEKKKSHHYEIHQKDKDVVKTRATFPSTSKNPLTIGYNIIFYGL